ncbi:MAG TPA: hydrogenase nickel incorporation protein HypB [Opitutaceae bacterium]|nr:hydrogenase nickel incorporation protein HypB [Opitutaceae bacterium]
MCTHCGCSNANEIIVTNLQTGDHVHLHGDFDPDAPFPAHHHAHDHGPEAGHAHRHPPPPGEAPPAGRTIRIEQELLNRNARLAERNRGWLAGRGVAAVNLMSSPGAGKTTLLEATLRSLGSELAFHVIEGDQATLRDAERIRAAGGRAVQINTGTGCHLDAAMVAAALRQLDPAAGGVVVIENVGNLVCPALFDLGEHARVVVASVTEGDDKPSKYPHMFRAANVVVLNKIDLLPHVAFDGEAFERRVRELNPAVRLFRVSATGGAGMDEWRKWVKLGLRENSSSSAQ